MRKLMIILFLIIDLIGGISISFYISSFYVFSIFLFSYLITNIISWKFLIKLFSLRVNCIQRPFWILIKESIKKSGPFYFLLLILDIFIDVFSFDFYIIQITNNSNNVLILFFISFILFLIFLVNKVLLVLLL
jgi:hypothetical protein